MDDKEFLLAVQSGEMTIEEGMAYLKDYGFQEGPFAKLDFHRKKRKGFGEVIFCEGKELPLLAEIYQSFYKRKESVLGTRCSKEQYEYVKERVPSVQYNELARTLALHMVEKVDSIGRIAVCTAGTADITVAEEARVTAEFLGAHVDAYYDVGVAGIHRLFAHMDSIKEANVIIAVAGMEGALPTVLAGMVDKPVLAVPTSVGYGASFHGVTALLTMLNSCAEGISVVNIDNGFGAGYQAAQINRLIERSR